MQQKIIAVVIMFTLTFLAGCGGDAEEMSWRAGCKALDVGVSLKGAERDAQRVVLTGIVEATNLSDEQKEWAKTGIRLLSYDDIRKAPKTIRIAAGAPCADRGHAIPALRSTTRP